jgi:sugar transferase (PEP-CTERM/EpsH1 system associated)
MRVLFVTSRFPGDLRRGDEVRAFQHIRYLSRGHAITLLACARAAPERERLSALERYCENVIVVPRGLPGMLFRAATALAGDEPLQAAMYASPALRRTLRALLEREQFDLVHVQLARLGPLLSEVRATPCVLDFVDALSLNMANRAARERGPMGALAALEAARLSGYERTLAARVDAATISAAGDAEAIDATGGLHLVANGVDTERFAFTPPRPGGGEIVFVGNLGYFPNIEGASWFAREVLPRIRREVPDARLRLVGARPARRLARLAAGQEGIDLVGEVAQVQPEIIRADVAIAPLRAGSGQQTKILEAMAIGRPVVATRASAAAMQAIPDEHLLVADAPEEFALAVLKLLRDPPLRNRLAANARRLVEQRYTWEQSAQALERVWLAAARSRG